MTENEKLLWGRIDALILENKQLHNSLISQTKQVRNLATCLSTVIAQFKRFVTLFGGNFTVDHASEATRLNAGLEKIDQNCNSILAHSLYDSRVQ